MNELIVGFVGGLILAGLVFVSITKSVVRDNACDAGSGEYYINTNNYSKEFRWKVCK